MSFIQREVDRIHAKLLETPQGPLFDQLYAAQQALSWALDPRGCKRPLPQIMGIPEDLEDYLVTLRPLPSSDICGLADLPQSH